VKRPRNLLRDCPVVEVTWFDAVTDPRWLAGDEVAAQKPIECRTLGRLFARSKTSLTLAASVNFNGNMGEVTTIPAGWVVKIRHLRGAAPAAASR
jgi:hypothetical protein